MARRALPALLLATAAVADAGSAPGLAFYAVLVAIPVVATVALSSFGELLDARSSARPERLVQGLVWALLLVLLVFGASVRAPDVAEGVVPTAAVSTLVAGLVALALEAALDLCASVREAQPETHALAAGGPGTARGRAVPLAKAPRLGGGRRRALAWPEPSPRARGLPAEPLERDRGGGVLRQVD